MPGKGGTTTGAVAGAPLARVQLTRSYGNRIRSLAEMAREPTPPFLARMGQIDYQTALPMMRTPMGKLGGKDVVATHRAAEALQAPIKDALKREFAHDPHFTQMREALADLSAQAPHLQVEAELAGKPQSAEERARAQMALWASAHAPVINRPLYRGVLAIGDVPSYHKGQVIDMLPSPFSRQHADPLERSYFTTPGGAASHTRRDGTVWHETGVVYRLAPGARALPFWILSAFPTEQEYTVQGRFRVTSVRTRTARDVRGDPMKRIYVTIEQTGVYDPGAFPAAPGAGA